MRLPCRNVTAGPSSPRLWHMQIVSWNVNGIRAAERKGFLDWLGDARIVSLSSVAHLRSPVVFEDLNFSSRPYDPLVAYGQSKTANSLFAVEATRRWASDGITANAVHPGAIAVTNLSRHMDREALAQAMAAGGYDYKTSGQGAATSVLVATSQQLDGIGGR